MFVSFEITLRSSTSKILFISFLLHGISLHCVQRSSHWKFSQIIPRLPPQQSPRRPPQVVAHILIWHYFFLSFIFPMTWEPPIKKGLYLGSHNNGMEQSLPMYLLFPLALVDHLGLLHKQIPNCYYIKPLRFWVHYSTVITVLLESMCLYICISVFGITINFCISLLPSVFNILLTETHLLQISFFWVKAWVKLSSKLAIFFQWYSFRWY